VGVFLTIRVFYIIYLFGLEKVVAPETPKKRLSLTSSTSYICDGIMLDYDIAQLEKHRAVIT
jgi:hypothetical protein